MTGYHMKRTIAAALAAMMIGGCMPFGALAEELENKPLVEQVETAQVSLEAPIAKKELKADLKLQEIKLVKTADAQDTTDAQTEEEAPKAETGLNAKKIEKLEKIDKLEKLEKFDKIDKLEKFDKIDKIEKLPEDLIVPIKPGASDDSEDDDIKDEPTTENQGGAEEIKPVTPADKIEILKPVTPSDKDEIVKPLKPSDKNEILKPVTPPEAVEVVDIQAKIEKGTDYIIITVTKAADVQMMVSVDGIGDKAITKGGSVRYDGLTPGKSYAVEIDYLDYIAGAKKYAATVTLDKPEELGEIDITSVIPATNVLVVYGTATAGQQVILTTKPAAAADVYVMPDAKGVFKAEIACAAGTYTAVTAKYSADTSKSHKITGKWVVDAPAKKPSLTVDPIDTRSTTVVAKTSAGVVVEIKCGNYKQMLTADNHGILRYSLPHTYDAGTELTFTVYYGDEQSFTKKVKVVQAAYTGTLEYDMEGEAVKQLTARLEKLGYPITETSRYGSKVREAVRLFQIANGLTADGIAGPETQKAIFSLSAIAYGSDKYPTLVRGDEGLALIYTLQQRLKDLGYYTIKVDGIFGSATQRAVREFQRVNGLTVTGKADNATQTLLYSSAAKSAGYAVSGDYKTLSRSGKYVSAVVPLQKRLRALGYYSGNIDGYFGSQTYRAVRNFQSRNGLTVTGVADPYTQQILYSASAKTYSGSTASSGVVTSGYRLLYWGCRGEAVTRLQNALINAGYKSIVRYADGIFGQWTYDAVRAYQKDHGLAVDGIAGKNTQNKLYGTSY